MQYNNELLLFSFFSNVLSQIVGNIEKEKIIYDLYVPQKHIVFLSVCSLLAMPTVNVLEALLNLRIIQNMEDYDCSIRFLIIQ